MYPTSGCSLHHVDAFQLLVATILSAQCTDERVNQVTPILFRRWNSPQAMAQASEEELIDIIRPTGFFRNKAKNILGASRMIVDLYGGNVPDSLEELVRLPGVGRKTANVILSVAYHKPAIVVDTHVGRISRHLGFTLHKNPVNIEYDLQHILPQEHWIKWNHMIIDHGRAVCHARKPRCEQCALCDLCPGPFTKLGEKIPKRCLENPKLLIKEGYKDDFKEKNARKEKNFS
ncbi:MAG: endonuclease III [Candidatus Marinimicrobia bacterium]|nr:endonuclease III [Candidatus Neomarinimicrobiota bacterium]